MRYLTQEWLDECVRLGSELPERQGAAARIQYVIDGDRPVRYHVIFSDGRPVAAALGELADAEVTLTMSYADSVAVQRGELDPNAAFSDGRIGFDGDMRSLMSLLPVLWPSPTRRRGSAALPGVPGGDPRDDLLPVGGKLAALNAPGLDPAGGHRRVGSRTVGLRTTHHH